MNPIHPDLTPRLRACLTRYASAIPGLARLAENIDTATSDRYEQCYPLLEQALWSGQGDFDTLLADYQALFREQEALMRHQAAVAGEPDKRHHFILSIPVADRPAHLRTCLESILQVCNAYGYGGTSNGTYTKIQVVIAEDSRDNTHIRQHIALAGEYTRKGLQVTHFGLDEQYQLLQAIPAKLRNRLGQLLTTQPKDRFYHKGQAANRNLSILKCLQLTEHQDRTLYYFVDSDESFCVNRLTDSGETTAYALNYFHAIDRIFRHSDTHLLTGRMVGDPPVSPSVMAANFLADLLVFFTQLATLRGNEDCRFHGQPRPPATGASYHDMAGLFGFHQQPATYPYRCPLQGRHGHAACLRTLARQLAAFFFGVHLTRKTYFEYGNGFQAITPARTVYPGNSIASYAGLKTIIPFGHLRLRMSGPTAGRLIAAELGTRFATANLPHLHQRTNEAGLDEAFRPGVELAPGANRHHPGVSATATRNPVPAPGDTIDLSDEFERQFFGDLLLFTTEELARETATGQPFARDDIRRIMDRKEQDLLALYQQKHHAIVDLARQLNTRVFESGYWWQHDPELASALQQVRTFIENIRNNFGEQATAWQQIRSPAHRTFRKQQLLDALLHYHSERNAWDELLGGLQAQ